MRTGRGLIGPLLLLCGAWLLLRTRFDVAEVRGRSMAPALRPGDRLLVARLGRPPRRGEVVLAPDPRDASRELIKRVADVGPGGVTLRGDNQAASTDGRTFGFVGADRVRWRVVGRYWPLDRVGAVPPAGDIDWLDEGGEPACAVPEALIAGD